MWLVRKIAKEPILNATRETVQSIYAFNGYAPEAVRFVVQFPNLRFTEGVVDEVRRSDRSVFRWDRLPLGLVRFSGRRAVQNASDCRENEVSVPILRSRYPLTATWHCTAWTAANSVSTTHEVGFSVPDYRVGPYAVFERQSSIVRRSDKQPVNKLIKVASSGGIWWRLTDFLGDVTGTSAIANGNTVARYGASTADYLNGLNPEEFLVTGRLQLEPSANVCNESKAHISLSYRHAIVR